MKIIQADLLTTKIKYIAHQCNCLTIRSHGLSKYIADNYPWADIYKSRKAIGRRNCAIEKNRDIPGTVKIIHSQNNTKAVICMFGQWAPSVPQKYKSYPNYEIDTYDNRAKWFEQCLNQMKTIKTKSIAFPWKIGCGLAGGDWNLYKKLLEDFEKESGIEVVLYKLV